MGIVFITGVNGFIGRYAAERLLSLGHRVRGMVRRTSDISSLRGLEVELSFGDVTDRATLAAPMRGADIVLHAAARVSDWGPSSSFHAVNVEGTRNVAEEAALAGVRRLVHLGTAAVHGFPGFRGLVESAPMADTVFPYCETKKEAERWLFRFAGSTPMEVVVVRPGNVFGPGDRAFIGRYLDTMAAGKLVYVDGGRRWTAPAYVENLVGGLAAACFEPLAGGEAFFLTDGLAITWREFTEAFAAEMGVSPPRFSIPFAGAYAAGALLEAVYRLFRASQPPLITRYRISNGGRDYHFSIEKARRLLLYRPEVGFGEAVRRTVRWYRERG